MQTWRLLPFLKADGARQMAIDAAIFRAVELGQSPPTIRFYQWDPIAISLGYHQQNVPEHWKNLWFEGQPVELIRRPTGGRAVLHQGDLTYAVITHGMPASREAAYRQICEFLIQGWRSLSVELSYGMAGRGYIQNPNCFATSTAADLVLSNGYKLIGSAQKRSGHTILQHGSMRLNPNPSLFGTVFGPETQQEIQNCPVKSDSWPAIETIMTALIQAAESCFSMELQMGELQMDELTPAEQDCLEEF